MWRNIYTPSQGGSIYCSVVNAELSYYFIVCSKPSSQVLEMWEGMIHNGGPEVHSYPFRARVKDQTSAKSRAGEEAPVFYGGH